MEKHFETLAQGVTFSAVSTDKSKYDLITVNFFLPLTAENKAKAAVLTSVINRGTLKYPTMRDIAIAEEELYAANIGAFSSSVGETVKITFSVSYINKAYTIDGEDITGKVLGMLYQLVLAPLTENGGFKTEYVESEKKNTLDIIKSRTDNKSSYAVSRCVELMCEGEAISISQECREREVSAIDGKNLYEFYKKVVNTCPVHIMFCGNENGKSIADKFRFIGNFPMMRNEMPKTDAVYDPESKRRTFDEKMDTAQSKLCIGYRIGIDQSKKDWLKFLVFDEIFAYSPASKLFLNVREKNSLCYYCSPVVNGIKGLLIITAGIESKDKDKTYKAITKELEKMRKGDFTDEELQTAKRNIASSFRSITDSVNSLNGFYLTRFAAGIDISPMECEMLAAQVTKEDVIMCAGRLYEDSVYFLDGTEDEK